MPRPPQRYGGGGGGWGGVPGSISHQFEGEGWVDLGRSLFCAPRHISQPGKRSRTASFLRWSTTVPPPSQGQMARSSRRWTPATPPCGRMPSSRSQPDHGLLWSNPTPTVPGGGGGRREPTRLCFLLCLTFPLAGSHPLPSTALATKQGLAAIVHTNGNSSSFVMLAGVAVRRASWKVESGLKSGGGGGDAIFFLRLAEGGNYMVN